MIFMFISLVRCMLNGTFVLFFAQRLLYCVCTDISDSGMLELFTEFEISPSCVCYVCSCGIDELVSIPLHFLDGYEPGLG